MSQLLALLPACERLAAADAQAAPRGRVGGPTRSADALEIEALLRSARGSCLPLPAAEIERRRSEFEVARSASGRVIACAALRQEAGRCELRCLVVDAAWRGSGVGRSLVERVARRAFALGRDLFCVSRCPAWFEALGFDRLPPEFVPARPGAQRGRHALVRRRETPRTTSPERTP